MQGEGTSPAPPTPVVPSDGNWLLDHWFIVFLAIAAFVIIIKDQGKKRE